MDISSTSEQSSPPPLDRFHEVEIGKLFDAMITLHNIRLQAATFFGTFDLGALTIGTTSEKAIMFIFGGIFLCIGYLIDHLATDVVVRFYYRSLELQTRFAPNDTNTFLSLLFLDPLGEKLRDIMKLTDEQERLRHVARLASNNRLYSSLWILLVVGVAEIILGLVLWQVFHWALI